MTTPISQPTDTPCVGVCSTIYGDLICRGCKRFYDEIIDWNTYEDSKKLEVLNRLNRLKTETVQDYLEVIDAQLLKAKCRHHKIRIREEFTPYTWAYLLLREGANKITDLAKFGLLTKPDYQTLSFRALYEQIDDDLFSRAERFRGQ